MTLEEISAVLVAFTADGREVSPDAVVDCPTCVAGRVRRLLALLPEEDHERVKHVLAELAKKSSVYKGVQQALEVPQKKRPSKKVW